MGLRRESWSIAEVARLGGVSSRTLRHYDEVGLLEPAYYGSNGYRYYERPQLQRLQEVLVLRALGLGLPAIERVVSGAADRAVVLREHRAALLCEGVRLTRLAEVVGRTIEELEGGARMSAEEMFEGFDEARQTEYERQVVERWGRPAQDAIDRVRAQGWSTTNMADMDREFGAIGARLVPLIDAGVPVSDERVLEVMADHYALVARSWTPDAEQYTALGGWYVEDDAFRARYDAEHPQMAEYLRDAAGAYAVARLTL